MAQTIPEDKQLKEEFRNLILRVTGTLDVLKKRSDIFSTNSLEEMVRENKSNREYLITMYQDLARLQKMAERMVLDIRAIEHKHGTVSQLQMEIDKLRHRLSELEQFEKRAVSEGGVFISYSHADKLIVDSIEERFKADSINYWRDEKDLLIGQVIDKAISDGIQKSWLFMIILSPNSVHSKWVEREFDEASYEEIEGNKFILPVVCGGLDSSKVPARIRRKLYADITKDFESGYQKIKRSILHHLKEQKRKVEA